MTSHFGGQPPIQFGKHWVTWISDRAWCFGPECYVVRFLFDEHGGEAGAVQKAIDLAKERENVRGALNTVEAYDGAD